MKTNHYTLSFLAAVTIALSACSTAEPIDNTPILLSRAKLTEKVLDENYASVVAMRDINLGPTDAESAFGPQVGRYFLTDDFSVYRHLKPVQQLREVEPPVVNVLKSVKPQPPVVTPIATPISPFEQLTYFLVNPDGIVTGIATGRITSNPNRCITVEPSSEVVTTCEDSARLNSNLQLFDDSVRTLDGQSVSSWSAASAAATAQ